MTRSVWLCWARYLFFRARAEDWAVLSSPRLLGPALIATALAGMGRYWDHPSPHLLQRLGVGSLVYVLVLGAVLWLIVWPLRANRWGYRQVVTLVALTSPPALLYAIPVERWLSLNDAIAANAWFLAIVALWRVGLLLSILRGYAGLSWPRVLVAAALPLVLIVIALAMLNLEKAVFEIMGGFRRPTPNDGAYLIVLVLSFLSMYAVVPLLMVYATMVYRARKAGE